MFFSAQLPISSQISSLAELIHLSWFQSRFEGFGLNVTSYVKVSKNEIKTPKHLVPDVSATLLFSSPNHSVLLSCHMTAVQSVVEKNAATHGYA